MSEHYELLCEKYAHKVAKEYADEKADELKKRNITSKKSVNPKIVAQANNLSLEQQIAI